MPVPARLPFHGRDAFCVAHGVTVAAGPMWPNNILSNRQIRTLPISEVIARQYSERFALSIPEWRVMAALGNTPGLSARTHTTKTARSTHARGHGEPYDGVA